MQPRHPLLRIPVAALAALGVAAAAQAQSGPIRIGVLAPVTEFGANVVSECAAGAGTTGPRHAAQRVSAEPAAILAEELRRDHADVGRLAELRRVAELLAAPAAGAALAPCACTPKYAMTTRVTLGAWRATNDG